MTSSQQAPADTSGLSVENLVVRFAIRGSRSKVHAVDDVSLTIPRGHIVGVVGESGSGKSTIARTIVGLIRPQSGSVHYGGRDLTTLKGRELRDFRRSRQIQMIWQDPSASFDPRLTVRSALQMGMEGRRGADEDALEARCSDLLRTVGLPESVMERHPSDLSGGQNQRVAIARALLGDPDLIVADEPTSALDVSVQASIGNHFVRLNQRHGTSILLVSHDLGFVTNVSHDIVVLYLGQVMETGPAEDIAVAPKHPYTAALLAAMPTLAAEPDRDRFRLQGEIPSPIDPPEGCRFNTRCPFATDLCRTETPRLRAAHGSGEVACHHAERLVDQLIDLASGKPPAVSTGPKLAPTN